MKSVFRHPLRLILAAYLALALVYAWATPPFEASDELWHVGMVQYIAETGQLPVQVVGESTPYEQEGSQPPLYYLLAAALVKPLDRGDFEAARQPNPHVVAGVPGYVGSKNLVLHDSPPAGMALAVYMLRMFSIALGGVTVWAVYRSAKFVTEGTRWTRYSVSLQIIPLLAAGLTAFNPMFLFISASVNNDNLVTALNSLVIWLMLVMLAGPHPHPLSHEERGADAGGLTPRRSLMIAVLIALASLSKLSGLVLVPVVALAALWTAYRRRDWRGLVTLGALMAGVWAVLAGWWYVRNFQLYGELFGTGTMAAVAGMRETPFTFQTMLDEFQGFRFGYWGVFGAFNIMTFRPFYDVMDALTALALAGLVIHLWRARRDREPIARLLLLGLIVVIGAAAVIAWTAQTYASQGRLLFPYAAAICPLLALGLAELTRWLGPRRAAFLPAMLTTALALFALIVPFASIAPVYVAPEPLERLPDSARPVYARFGEVALIGYETPDRRYAPGDMLPVTVYWQVLEKTDRDLSLYLHAVLMDGSVIGKVDSYPGGGRLRTTTWQPGAIYADEYAIPLPPLPPQGEGSKTAQAENGPMASKLRVQVGWWFYPAEDHIPATTAEGQPMNVVMLDAGGFADGRGELAPEGLTAAQTDFGEKIRLLGWRRDETRLTLYWEVIAPPGADYTVFAQWLDAANEVAAQGDAPPDLPTRFLLPGERYVTRHIFPSGETLAAGDYRLMIGWYDPLGGQRLAAGTPDDALLLETLTVR